MTATEITNYLVNEYGECKHDTHAMSEAINDMAEEINANEWDLFHLSGCSLNDTPSSRVANLTVALVLIFFFI